MNDVRLNLQCYQKHGGCQFFHFFHVGAATETSLWRFPLAPDEHRKRVPGLNYSPQYLCTSICAEPACCAL